MYAYIYTRMYVYKQFIFLVFAYALNGYLWDQTNKLWDILYRGYYGCIIMGPILLTIYAICMGLNMGDLPRTKWRSNQPESVTSPFFRVVYPHSMSGWQTNLW